MAIDADLQEYTARRMGEESGSCVILDCLTGDILAMVSMPAYDPNSFSDGIGRTEWKTMSEDPRKPLLNKVLNAPLPARLDPEAHGRPCATAARHRPEGPHLLRRWLPARKPLLPLPGRHGSVDMHRAIAKSCNTYFYAMSNRIGYDKIAPTARQLGLGKKFDLPVVSQNYGTIPDSEWKRRKYEQNKRLIERPDWTNSTPSTQRSARASSS